MDAYGVTVTEITSSGVHQPTRPCTVSCRSKNVVSGFAAPLNTKISPPAQRQPSSLLPCATYICRRERSLKERCPVARAEADDGTAIGSVAGGFSFSRVEAGNGGAVARFGAATARAGAFSRAFPPRPDVVARGLVASGAPVVEA